jgi:hypothetical protein
MTGAPRFLTNIFGYLISLAWQCIRLTLPMCLVILEPVMRFILGWLALLGVLMALFWRAIGAVLVPYDALLWLLRYAPYR